MSRITADQFGINFNGSPLNNVGSANTVSQSVILQQLESFVPVGTVKLYAGVTQPDQWLFCDGAEVSRAQYPRLFSAIGTVYGQGDGSTTFNVPNLQGKVPIGSNSSSYILGTVGGQEARSLTTDHIPAHTHTGTSQSAGDHSHTGTSDAAGSHSHNGTSDAAGSHSHSGTSDSAGSHSHSGTTNTSGNHTHSNNAIGSGSPGSLGVIQQSIGGQNVTPTGFDSGLSGSELNIYNSFPLTINSSGDHQHTVDTNTANDHQHTFSTSTASAHQHTFGTSTASAHQHTFGTSTANAHQHTFTTDSTGNGSAFSIVQPYLCMNYIIKV